MIVFISLARMTSTDRGLRDKAFNIAKNSKYDKYQRGVASVVYKVFDKKSEGRGFKFAFKDEIKKKEQLVQELHKSFIRKFEKIKVH